MVLSSPANSATAVWRKIVTILVAMRRRACCTRTRVALPASAVIWELVDRRTQARNVVRRNTSAIYRNIARARANIVRVTFSKSTVKLATWAKLFAIKVRAERTMINANYCGAQPARPPTYNATIWITMARNSVIADITDSRKVSSNAKTSKSRSMCFYNIIIEHLFIILKNLVRWFIVLNYWYFFRNILCGMLHCKHLNERLEFGMESVAILSQSFINNGGKIIACRSAMVDLGLNQVDPGLAPDGAKCAPGKMCVNQKCMPIADLRKSITGRSGCPNDCGGNGVCNSLGHCHCHRGFHPPDCVQPGFGGSDDSGPAEDPNGKRLAISSFILSRDCCWNFRKSVEIAWKLKTTNSYWFFAQNCD